MKGRTHYCKGRAASASRPRPRRSRASMCMWLSGAGIRDITHWQHQPRKFESWSRLRGRAPGKWHAAFWGRDPRYHALAAPAAEIRELVSSMRAPGRGADSATPRPCGALRLHRDQAASRAHMHIHQAHSIQMHRTSRGGSLARSPLAPRSLSRKDAAFAGSELVSHLGTPQASAPVSRPGSRTHARWSPTPGVGALER
ncbi:hypothetical protein B0H10DRAFT_375892 [Mycena sp. CBHHK59/15]|nr:hypothetical protein B0H10DRAFT_375892 [Mycena sp. CBHHK59/15]